MTNKIKVWLLTKEYNDYDQHGEYFVAVFADKPTKEQLVGFDVSEELIEHVLAGGGRVDSEYEWFNLKQIETA